MDFFIVTPSYNQKKFLQQTIDSILNQKLTGELNYWVFDGGSTDGSKEVLKKYDKKISWQSKKDKGQTDALNKGVKELRKWLKETNKDPKEVVFAYLNSDDYYLTNTFSIVEQHFNDQPDKKWLVGDCLIVNENGQPIQSAVRWYKKIWLFWLNKATLGVLNPIPQPGVFIRATEILKNGFFDQQLHYTMDYDYWFRLLANTGQPIKVFEPLAAFRIHQLSKGGQQYIKQFAEQYKVTQRYSKNRVILGLQNLHNYLVIGFYKLAK